MKTIMMCTCLLFFAANAGGQLMNRDLPNSFTFSSAVPQGCLTVVPSVHSAPPASAFFDQLLQLSDNGAAAQIRLRAWRIGCHEPNSSAIMLNVALASGSSSVRYPDISLATRDGDMRPAGLFAFPRRDFYLDKGASLRPMTDQFLETLVDGFSFVVDVDSQIVSRQAYNDDLVLRLSWPLGPVIDIGVPAYDSDFDFPQFSNPALHGRYTGQWVIDGLPRQGLMLQIGELPPDRNFAFLSMFTYIDGFPAWIVGNADFPIGADSVTVNMWLVEGGEFFTEPLNSYTREDVTQEKLGTMTISPRHCNVIDAEIDFNESGLGLVHRRFERLVRIAGYDCDQTR